MLKLKTQSSKSKVLSKEFLLLCSDLSFSLNRNFTFNRAFDTFDVIKEFALEKRKGELSPQVKS